jgi:hypothetical protein
VWGTCNTLINYSWIIDQSLTNPEMKFSLNQLRWVDFFFLTVRSLFCILITSIKPIYDSYQQEGVVIMPLDNHSLEEFENILHNQTGIEYFFKYLEE